MFILLIKASMILVILLGFYKLILEQESFFSANRLYLLSCLGLAFLLPFIVLPKMVENQGYFDTMLESTSVIQDVDPIISYQSVSQEISKPERAQQNYETNKIPEGEAGTASIKVETGIAESSPVNSKGFMFWILWVYIFGVGVLSINLIAQIVSVILKIAKNKDQIEDDGITIVNMNSEVEPCSFFNYIFINPSTYDFDTYEQIIAHEKIHVNKKHTLDLLISEIAVILMWFNPFVWIFRKEVEKNLEYQTDDLLINEEKDIKQEYQMNLVKIACNTSPLAITTNYNQSLIKQRILKMNSKRSNSFNYWKYAFGMPLLFVMLLLLNKPIDSIANSPELGKDLKVLSDLSIENDSNEILDTSINIDLSDKSGEDEAVIEKSDSKNKKFSISKNADDAIAVSDRKGDLSIQRPQTAIQSTSEMIADCTEFEKAVAEGDLEKVKEILKTLDPDCLTLKNNNQSNLSSVKKMVNAKKNTMEEDESPICAKLKKAVDRFDRNKARWILLEEDISCLNDVYGDPIRDEKLLKGLLRYGAHLDIDKDKVIHIDDIGFTISVPKEKDDCKDPSFLKLVDAIKNGNQSRVKNLLSNEDFACPLGQNEVDSDFPFIKELMKYNPEVLIVNKESVTVYGVGMILDLDLQMKKANNSKEYKDDPVANYRQAQLIDDIEELLGSASTEENEVSCLSLMDAIILNDHSLVKKMVKLVNLNCYHRHTNSESSESGTRIVSDETVTPLIAAAMQGSYQLVDILLENNADVNYTGDGDITPLMVAVMSGNLACVKKMVENKAKLNETYTDNMTALDIAIRDLRLPIVDYLKSKGAKSNIY